MNELNLSLREWLRRSPVFGQAAVIERRSLRALFPRSPGKQREALSVMDSATEGPIPVDGVDSYVAQRLVEAGFLARVPDPSDLRRTLLKPSSRAATRAQALAIALKIMHGWRAKNTLVPIDDDSKD